MISQRQQLDRREKKGHPKTIYGVTNRIRICYSIGRSLPGVLCGFVEQQKLPDTRLRQHSATVIFSLKITI
jgi:hypothetical protein